jgi:hypothetical protein
LRLITPFWLTLHSATDFKTAVTFLLAAENPCGNQPPNPDTIMATNNTQKHKSSSSTKAKDLPPKKDPKGGPKIF